MIEVRVDGESVVVGSQVLTVSEAREMANRIVRMAEEAARNAQVRAEDELRAKVEAEHPGGRWHKGWYGRQDSYVYLAEDGPRTHRGQYADWRDLPSPQPQQRIRVFGGRVGHVWESGSEALCGVWVADARIAPEYLRVCKACQRVLDER